MNVLEGEVLLPLNDLINTFLKKGVKIFIKN